MIANYEILRHNSFTYRLQQIKCKYKIRDHCHCLDLQMTYEVYTILSVDMNYNYIRQPSTSVPFRVHIISLPDNTVNSPAQFDRFCVRAYKQLAAALLHIHITFQMNYHTVHVGSFASFVWLHL